MGLDAMEPAAPPESPPPPGEPAGESGPPDMLVRVETDSDSVGSPAIVNSDAPEMVDHAYAPLLARLEADCRHVVSVAESEVETLRTRAQEDAQRIVADAHRERFMLLSRASEKQARMYQEAEADIDRWLDELEEQRIAVLGGARREYEQMVRKHFEAAEREARSIIEAAHAEAMRTRASAAVDSAPAQAPPAQAAPHADTDSLFWRRDASAEQDVAWIVEPVDDTPTPEPSADTPAPPMPDRRTRKHRRWFRGSKGTRGSSRR